jgi:hypothetical protein
VLGVSKVEDRNVVVVGDPQRLAGPADTPTTTVKTAIRSPTQHEPHRTLQVGSEYLMTVARVQTTHALRQMSPCRMKLCGEFVGGWGGLPENDLVCATCG